MTRYKLSKSTIYHVLEYDKPERARARRKGRPVKLINAKVDEIIEFLSDSWEDRILD